MKTLIRGATLLTMAGEDGDRPITADLLIEGERIAAIAPRIPTPEDVTVIDGRGRLVMPGLVNGHLHSSESFFKGRYERLPLELWLLYAYPLLDAEPVSDELLRLRTLLVAIESLKGGVTTICDNFFDPPVHSLDRLAVVFSAYEAAGIRAGVSSAVMNLNLLDTMPHARKILPADIQDKVGAYSATSVAEYIAFSKAAFARLDGRAGRLRYMLSPSAPQRCTPELLLACDALAREHGVPFHTHVLETKTQAVTGDLIYGKTLIRYMHELGLLHSGVTIAHSVWVNDEDIALMGAAGCSVVHNCLSNLKLGSGIAPIRRLIDAGVTVALGTDGASSNDTLRIFDVMRTAALLHDVADPNPSTWLSAREILRAATVDGARSMLLGDVTGSLAVGKCADLLILRTTGIDFTPLNDVVRQLVYCENGGSIEAVMVNGEIVCRDGRLTMIDEAAVLAEVRGLMPAYLARHAETEARNRALEPYFAEVLRQANGRDIGVNRYSSRVP